MQEVVGIIVIMMEMICMSDFVCMHLLDGMNQSNESIEMKFFS